MVVTIFIVSLITFFAFQIIPGDPVLSKLGVDADQAQIDALTSELNLDQPAIRRYFSWIAGIFNGDLGKSIRYDREVTDMIISRLPVTFSLTIMSMFLVFVFGIPIGILSAKNDKKTSGFFINFITQVSMAIPSFWTGILLMYFFGLILNWITPGAYTPWSENPFEAFKSLILPSLAIAIPNIAVIVRYLRNTILEQKNQDYTRTALSKGAKPGYVLTSSRKKVDVAAFEGIRSALYDRNFNSGHHVLGIEDEGMGISPMKYTKGMVPNEVIAELVFLQKLMKDGEVDIPQNEAELGSFDVNSINIPF